MFIHPVLKRILVVRSPDDTDAEIYRVRNIRLEMKMRKMVSKCPMCDGQSFTIEKVRCDECGTRVEGSFKVTKLGSLSQEHQDFIELFVKCRGNIKDVERELGVSYPTVRGRLDRVIHALGLSGTDNTKRRKDILTALERDELSPEEAVGALKDLS